MENQPATIPEKVAQVVIDYYRQTEKFAFVQQDLVNWYVQLSIADGMTIAALPTSSWYNLPQFKRHFLEQRGYSMSVYMAQHLTTHELTYWVDDGNGGALPK